MPHIFYTFQNRVSKIDFDSNAITAEKAKFLISQAIGTSDILELTVESNGSQVKERQLLESGTTVRVQRTANKSFRQSMRDAGGTQHKKRMRSAPNSGDVVIGISSAKTSQQLDSIYYAGTQNDSLGTLDDEFDALGDVHERSLTSGDTEANEERKFRILQERVRSNTRPEFMDHPSSRLPLNQKAMLNAQRKNAAVRSAETSFVDPPPSHYVCHACGFAGHWIYDCDIVKNRPLGSSSSSHRQVDTTHRTPETCSKSEKAADSKSQNDEKATADRRLRFLRMSFWTPEEVEQADKRALSEEVWVE